MKILPLGAEVFHAVYYKWLCWTEYHGLLQVVLLDGILRFTTKSIAVQFGLLHSQQFTNSYFHFLVTV